MFQAGLAIALITHPFEDGATSTCGSKLTTCSGVCFLPFTHTSLSHLNCYKKPGHSNGMQFTKSLTQRSWI